MTRKEPVIIEDENEEFKGVRDESEEYKDLSEGDRAIIEARGKSKTKFWRRYNGLKCVIVSRHKSSAIVEVLKYKELIICQMENLRSSRSARSR